MPTLKLYVSNLTRADDAARIETAVRALPGVYGAVAHSEGHCLEVDFDDDDVAISQIVGAISAIGYDVHLAS